MLAPAEPAGLQALARGRASSSFSRWQVAVDDGRPDTPGLKVDSNTSPHAPRHNHSAVPDHGQYACVVVVAFAVLMTGSMRRFAAVLVVASVLSHPLLLEHGLAVLYVVNQKHWRPAQMAGHRRRIVAGNCYSH
ncbi:MAG TPA: hypothetical protein VMH22_14625 [bacterium]|nr:hypothetical protein [bacterium]